jgi:uncharacterized alpha-E superfamily protein
VADVASVSHFMLFDEDNPSSVRSCLLAARTNARSVRTALTSDVWEAINSAWLEFAQTQAARRHRRAAAGAAAMGQAGLAPASAAPCSRPSCATTATPSPQSGNFVERADNTARILDMKYYVLLPRTSLVGGDVDIQQWTLILRAASAHRSYQHVYHDRFKAWNIADYLILRPEMPRSLIFCVGWINRTLDMLHAIYGRPRELPRRRGGGHGDARGQRHGPHLRLRAARVPHRVHRRNNRITDALSESYNFY